MAMSPVLIRMRLIPKSPVQEVGVANSILGKGSCNIPTLIRFFFRKMFLQIKCATNELEEENKVIP